MLAQLIIPPELIDIILDTEPSNEWLTAIVDLETRLTAIRSGPRVAARQSLDNVAEKLRIKAADKLRRFFINQLTPYRTSIALDLHALQESLLKYRSFYAFLQRHAPRQAHEVQKAYVAAIAWYYETGFRRYTRALERIRLKSLGRDENAPQAQASEGSLGKLSVFRNCT
jgi:hypothetical protein